MIPKIIHYCWFGGKDLPNLASRCIDSWKKILPEYEIKCWSEDNFEIENSVSYADEISKITGIPVAFTAVRKDLADKVNIPCILPIEIHVTQSWNHGRE